MFLSSPITFRNAEPVARRLAAAAREPQSRSMTLEVLARLAGSEPAPCRPARPAGQALRPDTGPGADRPCRGFAAATLVDTAGGWVPAGQLRRGALLRTFDGGIRPLAGVSRCAVWPDSGPGLVHVPGGALDNCDDLWLMPGQPVLIAAEPVRRVLGIPEVLVPAAALNGFRTCRLRPAAAPVEMVTLRFAAAECLWVNTGVVLGCDVAAHLPAPMTLGIARARALLSLIDRSAPAEDRAA